MAKKDYNGNSGHDNLTNGFLASPLFAMIGGPLGALASIFMGAAFDHIDERGKFEETVKFEPYHRPTEEDIRNKENEDIDATEKLEEMMWRRGAKRITARRNVGDSYQLDYGFKNSLVFKDYIKDGRIVLYKGFVSDSVIPVKEWNAELFKRPHQFLERLKEDERKYPEQIKLYVITDGCYDLGRYMYTVNNGDSYVVCANDLRSLLGKRKAAEKIDQLI